MVTQFWTLFFTYFPYISPLQFRYYDHEFYVFGTHQGRPHFKGIRNSEIKYNNITEKWTLSSLANEEMSLSTVKKMAFNVPLGSHEWVVEAEGAHCFHSANTTVRLTFSDCYPNKYTCNNGQCIPLRSVYFQDVLITVMITGSDVMITLTNDTSLQ